MLKYSLSRVTLGEVSVYAKALKDFTLTWYTGILSPLSCTLVIDSIIKNSMIKVCIH